ncbi:hypothetical protein GCM10028793_42920 [Nocardiopsis oceani]
MEQARVRLQRALPQGPNGPWAGVVVHTLGERDLLRETADLCWRDPGPDGPVLPVFLCDGAVLLGPVRNGPALASGCLVCLAQRWQRLRPDEERDALELGGRMRATIEPPHLTGFALDTVRALADVLGEPGRRADGDANGNPYVYRLDLANLGVRRHPLLPQARCPGCAEDTPDTPSAAVIEPRRLPKPDPGATRVRRPAEYRLPVAGLTNPVCGALAARSLPRLDNTTTAPTVGYVSVRGSGYLHQSYWGGHADRYRESLRLGLLEGLERSVGLDARRTRPTVRGSYRQFAAEAIDPRQLGSYDPSFYEHNPHYQPFCEETELTWVWGYSLRDRRPVLVPETSVYYHGSGADRKIAQECSNGCATGGSREEAVLHGIFERVERDAFLLAWYGRLPLTEITADSWERTPTRWMVARLAMYGYRVRFFDARPDFSIPVVIAVAERVDAGPGMLCFGAGANLDPEAAAESALREVAFEVPNAAAHTTRFREHLLAMATDFRRVRDLEDHPGLYGLAETRVHADHVLGPHAGPDPATVPAAEAYRKWGRDRPRNHDLTDDLAYCRDQLASAGFDTVTVDQTSSEQLQIGVHTMCVLTPGLLPIDFGWDRQRALVMPRIGEVSRTHGRDRGSVRAALDSAVPHPFP